MEAKKFILNHYDETQETVFVKDGENRYVIELDWEPGSMNYYGSVVNNGEKIASAWNDAVAIYRKLGCPDVKPLIEFDAAEHWDDNDEEEIFDVAVEEARRWLYS